MQDQQWVERVRTLLARAKGPREAHWAELKTSIDTALGHAAHVRRLDERSQTPYPVRRRNFLAQIGLQAKHYGLADEVQAFIYATGATVIQELDIDQLAALHGWLSYWIEAMQTGCDSVMAPPAR